MFSRITAQCVFFLLLFFIIWGCENKNSNNTTNDPTGDNADISVSPDFLKQNFPVLDSLSQQKNDLHKELNKYAYKLTNASSLVKSDEDLQELFEMRDKDIIEALHKEILDPIALNDGVFYHSAAGTKLDKELKTLGMQAIYAEGMYFDLGPSEMLHKEMEQYASEVFIWYMEFQSAKTISLMGEYPFLDLEGQGKMVAVGEQMRAKYPDHAFTQKIEKDFRMALIPLTDVHVVKSEFDKSYMVNGLATEFYPNATNIDALKKFVEQYPDLHYSKVADDILENMSEMESVERQWKDLYLVVLSWQPSTEETFTDEDGNVTKTATCANARTISNDFLDKGIAVPHVLQLAHNNAEECAVVYRFYADKNKADVALKAIKAKVSTVAGLVQLKYDPLKRIWSVVK